MFAEEVLEHTYSSGVANSPCSAVLAVPEQAAYPPEIQNGQAKNWHLKLGLLRDSFQAQKQRNFVLEVQSWLDSYSEVSTYQPMRKSLQHLRMHPSLYHRTGFENEYYCPHQNDAL